MTKPELQIEILLKEKREMRDHILETQRSMHRVMFTILTVATGSTTAFFSDVFSNHQADKSYLTFFLAQLGLALVTFHAILIVGQQVSAGYIAALENKINSIAKTKLVIFESLVSPLYFQSPRGASIYLSALLVLFFALMLITLTAISSRVFDSCAIIALLIPEALVIAGLYIWALVTIKHARKQCNKWLANPNE